MWGMERERETSMWFERGTLIHSFLFTSQLGIELTPRYVPWLGIELVTFWCIYRDCIFSFLKGNAGGSNKLREWNMYSLMDITGRADPTKVIGQVLWALAFRAGSTALHTLPSQRPSVQTSQSVCCWEKVKDVYHVVENDSQDMINFVI